MKYLKHIMVFFLVLHVFTACEDDEGTSFAFQDISAPTNLSAIFDIAQDDTGEVSITPTAEGASVFEVFFGDVENEAPTQVNPGETVTHIYGEGEFNLRVVAIGASGLTSELVRVVTISFTPPTNLVVDITISDTNPFEVTVAPTADNATVFDILFGDEEEGDMPTTIMAGETATHIYAETGEYTVTVVARGAGAATIEVSETVTISGASDPIALPITFDSPTVNYAFGTFNGASYEVVENPDVSGANPTASNVGAITNSGSEFEGGAFTLGTAVDFSGTNKTITMKFWSQSAIPILLKFEGGVNSERENEVVANHGGTGWEALSFNFATDAIKSFIDGSQGVGEPFVPTGQYATMVIFVDGPGTTAGTFYIDDIAQSGSGGGMTELLTNGDFEAGSAPWTAGVDGDPATVVTDGGNSLYSVNVEAAGDVFSVNLSQTGLTIVPGANYILTFDAWSDRDRSILAGIGLSGGDFSNRALPVNLSTSMQTFTLMLSATTADDNPFGDDNSRVLFDVGGEVGLVNIDNVSLVQGGDGSNTVTSGSGNMPAELLTNGDFEAGSAPWTAGVDGDPAPVIMDGSNSLYSVNVEAAGQVFSVNLSQTGLTIVPGANYILTFEASSDRDRSILAGIGLSGGDFSNRALPVNLSTSMQTFTLMLSATTADDNAFGDDNSRVLFDNGGEVGLVNIDNVSLVQGGDGSNTVMVN